MADTKPTATPVETDAATTRKRVGADFSLEEYALVREARFVKRLDKDSDVIKAALNEYFAKHGITVDNA